MSTPFQAKDAHNYLKNINADHAQKWAALANADYQRRRKLGGQEGMCRQFAIKHANKKILGYRPYERKNER